MDCPSCTRQIPDAARFCAFCGSPVPRCPTCEARCPSDAQFCGFCGTYLRDGEETSVPMPPALPGDLVTDSTAEALVAEDEKWTTHEREGVFGFVYDPHYPEQRFYLEEGDITVGAGDKNDFVLDRPAVSWNHALIICRNAKILLQDSASTNGTYVNGIRVTRPRELRHGDRVKFGNVSFRVWIKPQLRHTGDT